MATQATTKHKEVKARRNSMAGMILESLIDVASGKTEMTSSQLAAAKLYLSKTLPDLKAIEHTGEDPSRTTVVKIELS